MMNYEQETVFNFFVQKAIDYAGDAHLRLAGILDDFAHKTRSAENLERAKLALQDVIGSAMTAVNDLDLSIDELNHGNKVNNLYNGKPDNKE